MNLIQETPIVNKRRLGLHGGTVSMVSSDQGGMNRGLEQRGDRGKEPGIS